MTLLPGEMSPLQILNRRRNGEEKGELKKRQEYNIM
jgi:hypothetical protein